MVNMDVAFRPIVILYNEGRVIPEEMVSSRNPESMRLEERREKEEIASQ